MAIFATNEHLTFNDIQRYHGPVLKLVDIVQRGKNDKKPIKADKKPIKVVRQEAVIEYIKLNGRITNKEARELLELADSTTKRILKEMVEENILVVKGERKSREYLLKY